MLGNISCDGFTGIEISFMIYGMCFNRNFIIIESVSFDSFYLFLCICSHICTMLNNLHILYTMYLQDILK